MGHDARYVLDKERDGAVFQNAPVVVADDSLLDVVVVVTPAGLGKVRVELGVEAHVAGLASELGE